jgi:MYXO-CTERM domain-containing protein
MKLVTRILGAVAAVALATPTVAHASGYNQWRVCGGSFVTSCALVKINVVGSNVTIQLWNLSGNTAGSYGTSTWAGSIVNRIGFYNINPAVTIPTGPVSMVGPIRPGDNTPMKWVFVNVNGGVNQTKSGIASACGLPLLPQTPATPGTPNFWLNPCNTQFSNVANYVTFNFQLSPTSAPWNPNGAALALRFFNGPGTGQQSFSECYTQNGPGVVQNCYTVTPEPMSVTLLATGLVGLAGAGLVRRRRQQKAS